MRYIAVLIIAICVTFFTQVHWAVSGWEVEQTTSFVATLLSLFSTEVLLKVIFAIVVIILTFVISKLVRVRLFGYLESSSLGAQEW